MNARALSLFAALVLCAVLLGFGVTQETPVGGVLGSVTMKENGAPLVGAMVTFSSVAEGEGQSWTRTVRTDDRGTFALHEVPAGLYRLSASAKAHELKETTVSINEGSPTPLDLQLAPKERYLKLYASQRVFTPDESPRVEVHGFVNADDLSVEAYKLDPQAIASHGGLSETLSPLAHPEYGRTLKVSSVASKVAALSHRILKKDAEGTFVEDLDVPKLGEGLYWVQCEGGGASAGTYLNITKIALVTKSYGDQALCYVSDVRNGSPIMGATILCQGKSALERKGTTNADGLAQVSLGSTSPVTVVAVAGRSAALCGFYSNGDDNDRSDPNIRIFTYTDRPVYKPGDLIRFKSIVRRLQGSDYRLPGSGTAKVEVKDPEGNLLQTLDLQVTAHGAFNGSFSTSPEAAPGGYQIVTKAFGGEDTYYVPIASYRKPEFTISVKPSQPYFILGDKASATIECAYYFGGPVAGAKVHVSVFRSPHWSDMLGDEEGAGMAEQPDDSEGFQGGEFSQKLDTTTDAAGRAVVTFDTKAKNDPNELPSDYDYTIEASVTEAAGKFFSGQGVIKVVRASFSLDIQLSQYVVQPGEGATVTVATMSHDTPPKPVPNRDVELQVGSETWTNDVRHFSPSQTLRARTGPDGLAKFQLNGTTAGSMALRALATDDQGHDVTAADYIYVEGGTPRQGPKPGNLELVLDRKTYSVGSSAKAMIQCDRPGGSALVCVQADKVLYSRVVLLATGSTTIDIPVAKSFAPNAYVSVAYVRGKQFLEADKSLVVNLGERKLSVQVVSDRPTVKPGETVGVTVRTLDAQGQGVPADVSLAVVDASIYAIHPDRTDIIGALYPKRSNDVQTNYSFPEIYLDGGDKGGANIPVRSKFLDTAFWMPDVMTDSSGTARIQVPLPDNLTEWRATAVGATDESAVGMATTSFKARKDLMVRIEAPTFLVQQDERNVVVAVTNDTPNSADVHVRLDAEGIVADGDKLRRVSLAAGSSGQLVWKVSAPASGQGTLTAKAWIDGGASDGVREVVPIEPHGRMVEETDSGEVHGSQTLRFNLRPNADRNTGRLRLSVSPSIASAMLRSLDGLVGFPYGCVEQTMSRFLPSVLVAKMLDDIHMPQPQLVKSVPKIARDAVARLSKMRHPDGAWGWWTWDESDPFMTAYVLDGLDLSNKAGYRTDEIDVSQALEWSKDRLTSKKSSTDSSAVRAYLAYDLAKYGQKEIAARVLTSIMRAGLDPSTAAYAAMGFHELGSAYASSEKDALDAIVAKAEGTGAVVYWPNGPDQWGVEGTAVPLRALATLDPSLPAIPRAVRYLLDKRKQGDMWDSTRDTSSVLIALTAYLARTGEAGQTSDVRVSLNGRIVRELHFSPASIGDPDAVIEIPVQSLTLGENRVSIESNGRAPIYYSSDLVQYPVEAQIGQLITDSGPTVTRKYYVLESQRTESGDLKLMPSKDPVSQARSGDIVQCTLTINTASPKNYIMIEDPIPSNCRIVERQEPGLDESWDFWWSDIVIRDDRAAFFVTILPAGIHRIVYTLRAETPGVAHALPTVISNMYDSSDRGSSGENLFEVTP